METSSPLDTRPVSRSYARGKQMSGYSASLPWAVLNTRSKTIHRADDIVIYPGGAEAVVNATPGSS